LTGDIHAVVETDTVDPEKGVFEPASILAADWRAA